jgi:hypothetical protein
MIAINRGPMFEVQGLPTRMLLRLYAAQPHGIPVSTILQDWRDVRELRALGIPILTVWRTLIGADRGDGDRLGARWVLDCKVVVEDADQKFNRSCSPGKASVVVQPSSG